MANRYESRRYGLGRVYDAELGAWREPTTARELWHMQLLDEQLERSLVEMTL